MREAKRTTNALKKVSSKRVVVLTARRTGHKVYPSRSMSRYTINSERVLLGPAGKTGAGYRWTVRDGWVVRENGKQIAAFSTIREAMGFRDRRSADDDDAPGVLFSIFKLQKDGDLHFVEAVQTCDGAKGRVRELGAAWPGEYVIDNEETTERVFIGTRDKRKN
jgi:hypothetical protein